MDTSNRNLRREFKGKNGSIIVTDTGITIKSKGMFAKAYGDEIVPYKSITAIKFRRAGIFSSAGLSHARGLLGIPIRHGSQLQRALRFYGN